MVITLGRDPAGFKRDYGDVRAVGRINSAYAMPYETGLDDLGPTPAARAGRRNLERAQALRLSAPPPSPRAVVTKSPSNLHDDLLLRPAQKTCSTRLKTWSPTTETTAGERFHRQRHDRLENARRAVAKANRGEATGAHRAMSDCFRDR